MLNGLTTKMALGRLLLLSATLYSVGLTGCASNYRMWEVNDTRQIPNNDCRNKSIYIDALQDQLDNGKPVTQKGEDFNAQVSEIKKTMWSIRAICQPV